MDATARHLRLLTETIAAVNSSLDLQEVLATSSSTSWRSSDELTAAIVSVRSRR